MPNAAMGATMAIFCLRRWDITGTSRSPDLRREDFNSGGQQNSALNLTCAASSFDILRSLCYFASLLKAWIRLWAELDEKKTGMALA